MEHSAPEALHLLRLRQQIKRERLPATSLPSRKEIEACLRRLLLEVEAYPVERSKPLTDTILGLLIQLMGIRFHVPSKPTKPN